MNQDQRTVHVTRDSILKLLSDAEVARVSTAESAGQLADGDEYLDLEQLGHGVRRAHGSLAAMGGVVPRKAVAETTWSKIVSQLERGLAAGRL